MSHQNKMARKLRVAREFSDRRVAQREALAEKKRREEEARRINAAAEVTS